MFDTEELMRKLDPEWKRPAEGHPITLAFLCTNAADVDATYARLTEAGFTGKRSLTTPSGASATRTSTTRTGTTSLCSRRCNER